MVVGKADKEQDACKSSLRMHLCLSLEQNTWDWEEDLNGHGH